MRILVCGSRTEKSKAYVFEHLDRIIGDDNPSAIIHGCAVGPDRFSEDWAYSRRGDLQRIPAIERYPAEWNVHGKAAGFIRNKLMIDVAKPDLVIAFWDGKSKGTKSTIDLAEAAGIKVEIVASSNKH